MCRTTLALSVVLTSVLASEAGAAQRISLLDECDHPSRAAHVQSCEKRKWICLQDVGPAPRRPHEITHCATTYSQCMSRGTAASTVR
ncbi:hypothetical protein GGD83_004768 [Rhodoblastus sphagnicola]|nr:hypothetical protein [Rhodoblastus sphagnicola]